MAKWATQGWDEAESQAASATNFTRDFFITDGDEARIRVLSDEPFNIRDHYVKGKGWFTCSQGLYDEDCPLCAAGFKATNHFVFQRSQNRWSHCRLAWPCQPPVLSVRQ